MWVGGRTARSLRRAVELGDGWAPFGLRTAEIARDAGPARDVGPIGSRVVLQNEHPLDPIGEPDRDRGAGRRASSTPARPRSTSASSTTPPRTTSNNSKP